jgi:hypothetical protein
VFEFPGRRTYRFARDKAISSTGYGRIPGKEKTMRRFPLSLAVVVVSLALTALPAALAANPNVQHFDFSGSFTDPDFCGTGTEVNISFSGHGTDFLAPKNADFRSVVVGNTIFENALTGATVRQHFANQFQDTIISGDPEGLHIHEFVFKGLPGMFKLEHGGVLTRDAGVIVFHSTQLGEEEEISFEIVRVSGPHPEAESDFTLFCEVMPEALGIE